jgi:multiple sugar transport system substrate-binding protein
MLAKKKIFSFFLFILLFVMSACNGKKAGLKIALDIEDENRYTELFEYFSEITGIEISATYGEDISKLIGTKNEPDIIKTSTVVVQSMKDSLLDLNEYIESSDIDTDNYITSIIQALTIEDKVYALPTSINTSLLYYNKTLFDASADELRAAFNLLPEEDVYPKEDWTYADYQKAGVILSKYRLDSENKRIYTQFGAETQLNWWGEWLVYVNQMGGSFYEPGTNNRVSALNSPECLAATEFFIEKSRGDAEHKFAPDAIEAASSFSFLNGNVAMIFGGHMGDWFSYDLLGLDWGIQVLPTPVGKSDARGGEISADAFGISVRSKKSSEAFQFLKLIAGEEGAKQMYKYGKIGALKNMADLIKTSPEESNLDIEVAFKAVEKAITLPSEKDFSKVCREMVMSEIYKLMFSGRGSETDTQSVLNRIKVNVDKYYRDLYN